MESHIDVYMWFGGTEGGLSRRDDMPLITFGGEEPPGHRMCFQSNFKQKGKKCIRKTHNRIFCLN